MSDAVTGAASCRGGNPRALFEVLDDNLKVVGTLVMHDFVNAFKEQKNA